MAEQRSDTQSAERGQAQQQQYRRSGNASGTDQDLLRFMACGSVDDGKSTLIGHMLYDAGLIFCDQAEALERESRLAGGDGASDNAIDYSLLLDGLSAEREQGITIDVAYRSFATPRRAFIVADTPGHEEYTRNMAVGASFADLAVILVDATKGVLVQTRRHARICDLMGIRHFVFIVNKMDLVGYDEAVFRQREREVRELIEEFDPLSVAIIPTSATVGDNVTVHSDRMPWYEGKSLLGYLEEVDVTPRDSDEGFFMSVQRVARAGEGGRGFQGQVGRGHLRVGDEVEVLPHREHAAVRALTNAGEVAGQISRGQAATVWLDREIDISRGDVIARDAQLQVGDLLSATVLWMDDEPLVAGRNYLLKLGTKTVPATVLEIAYRIDIDDGSHMPTQHLGKNEIGSCEIATTEAVVYDRFRKAGDAGCDKALGTFILIDRISNATSACGTVDGPLFGARNISRQELDITRELRSAQCGQTPLTVWFTGLSGSGKSTLANALEKRLVAAGRHTMLLDGDNVRLGLNADLGFGEADRIENIRRVAEVAKLMNDAGLIVLVAFISPFIRDRRRAREICGDSFIEVYVSTPLEVCEARDTKGLYEKAHRGEIADFTGITSPYETPEDPEITIDTTDQDVDACVDAILAYLQARL